MSMTVE